MKNIYLIILLFSICNLSYGQESFKKKYFVPNYIVLGKTDTVYLFRDSLVSFKNLSPQEREAIKNSYKSSPTITKTEEVIINNKKVMVAKNIVVDQSFYETLSINKPQKMTDQKINGFVKFEEDGKLYVNRFLKLDSLGNYTRFPIAYYQLKNRQAVKLCFTEFSVSALVIPVKYRVKKNDLPEDFSTAVNGNIFVGYSGGSSSFFHQEKVGNKTNTWKLTGGFMFGASSVTLDENNTNLSAKAITDDRKVSKGLVNIGVGAAYAYNKINLGIFYGYDYAIGDNAEIWNYNKKPWWGIGLGYSLFNF